MQTNQETQSGVFALFVEDKMTEDPCGCFVCVCVPDPVPKGTQHPFADKQSNMRSCMSVQ